MSFVSKQCISSPIWNTTNTSTIIRSEGANLQFSTSTAINTVRVRVLGRVITHGGGILTFNIDGMIINIAWEDVEANDTFFIILPAPVIANFNIFFKTNDNVGIQLYDVCIGNTGDGSGSGSSNPELSVDESSNPPQNLNTNTWYYVIGGALAILAIAGIGYMYLKRRKK